MTREEAIVFIKGCLTDYLPESDYKKVDEVLQALKQPGLCDDVISRTDVLNLIGRTLDLHIIDDNVYIDQLDIGNAVYHLPSIIPKQRWTPCSEQMPKPNEEDGNGFYKAYLVQDGRWMDVARWDGKYWIAWGYSTVLLGVVAWMPLPTPYREGKHDEKN